MNNCTKDEITQEIPKKNEYYKQIREIDIDKIPIGGLVGLEKEKEEYEKLNGRELNQLIMHYENILKKLNEWSKTKVIAMWKHSSNPFDLNFSFIKNSNEKAEYKSFFEMNSKNGFPYVLTARKYVYVIEKELNEVKEIQKFYKENREENLKEYSRNLQKQIIQCDCGLYYTRSNRTKHLNTKVHKTFILENELLN